MAAPRFHMHLVVPSKLVGTIIELLEGEGILISIKSEEAGVIPKKRSPVYHSRQHAANGKTGADILSAFLKAHKGFTMEQVKAEFKSNGLAPQSASPRVSVAKARGLIRSVGHGQFEVTAKGANAT